MRLVARPSARAPYTPANIWGMPSTVSSIVPVRLPNEAIAALNEFVANAEGVNRTAWLREVILAALEAQMEGDEDVAGVSAA